MRLVLIVPSFPKLSETFIVSKFLGLLDKGWDVHIVCGKSERQAWEHFPELNNTHIRQRIHVVWPHRPRWLAALLTPIAFLRCFWLAPYSVGRYLYHGWSCFGIDTIRRFYLDATLVSLQPLLVHFEFGALAVERMYLTDLLHSKIVVSFRGYDLNFSGLEDPNYYQNVWNHAAAVHVLGEDLWRRAQCRGCPTDKQHVLIPPAIDTQFFDPGSRQPPSVAGTHERPLRILSVGRLEWKKGYEYCLQAVKTLTKQGIVCEYRIIGGGQYLEALAFARHQLALEEIVHFLDAQPSTEVKAQMQWADLFLHGAVSEGFCNGVMEAQAMQLPVVCSDAGGLPENVVEGETGFIVPRRDPKALADKLAVLAANPHIRLRMGEAGRQRIEKHFQLDDQIAAFDALYRQVLAIPDSDVACHNIHSNKQVVNA